MKQYQLKGKIKTYEMLLPTKTTEQFTIRLQKSIISPYIQAMSDYQKSLKATK